MSFLIPPRYIMRMHTYNVGDDLKTIAAKLWLVFVRVKRTKPKPCNASHYRYLKAAINDFISAPGLSAGSTLSDAIRSTQDNLKNEDAVYSKIFDTAITIDDQSVNLLSLYEELENTFRMAPE